MDVYLCKFLFYHTKVNKWILKKQSNQTRQLQEIGVL